MNNYPDGVTAADIDALFNDPHEPRWFYFEPAIVSLAVKAESLEHAMEILSAKFPQSDKTVELDYHPEQVMEEV